MEIQTNQVQLQIDPSWKQQVEPVRLRRAVAAVLETEGIRKDAEVTIVIVGDDEMIRMHETYRDERGTTDVLSFPFEAPAPVVGESAYLGDIVICYPQAERQAEAEGHTAHDELDLLTVHGMLHLLGYDDETDEARAKMWRRQSDVLTHLGLSSIAPQ